MTAAGNGTLTLEQAFINQIMVSLPTDFAVRLRDAKKTLKVVIEQNGATNVIAEIGYDKLGLQSLVNSVEYAL